MHTCSKGTKLIHCSLLVYICINGQYVCVCVHIYKFFHAGTLITTGSSLSGRGGSALVHIACSGCNKTFQFASSALSTTECRRNIVSYSLRLAAFVTRIGFSGYHKLFGRHLGMEVTSERMFYHIIKEAYPHITERLDEVCELGKEEMKGLKDDQLGSWKRAVTTSDGCWHIRGFFSQNATSIIRNWLTGALLWYGHACMKGSNPVLTEELYQGTAKTAEGYLAGVLFDRAKDEGCHIQINWQDQDSSSEKSFRAVYTSNTSSRVMKCGGHVGRAHEKALKSLKSKEFDSGYISRHKEDFPEVESVVCTCKGKKHSATCGCFSDISWLGEILIVQFYIVRTTPLLLQLGCGSLGGTMHEISISGRTENVIFIPTSCAHVVVVKISSHVKESHTTLRMFSCPLHALAYESVATVPTMQRTLLTQNWGRVIPMHVRLRLQCFLSFDPRTLHCRDFIIKHLQTLPLSSPQ